MAPEHCIQHIFKKTPEFGIPVRQSFGIHHQHPPSSSPSPSSITSIHHQHPPPLSYIISIYYQHRSSSLSSSSIISIHHQHPSSSSSPTGAGTGAWHERRCEKRFMLKIPELPQIFSGNMMLFFGQRYAYFRAGLLFCTEFTIQNHLRAKAALFSGNSSVIFGQDYCFSGNDSFFCIFCRVHMYASR